ncbi:MAG: hypothetical protein AB8B57_17335 [Congregibacter sp.]
MARKPANAELLVSLHLPKTAGTSFLSVLEQEYGERLCRDYDDRPLNQSPRRRCTAALGCAVQNVVLPSRFDQVDCIHGHFLPLKYRLLAWRRSVRFITWLRDPVERLASHYHYWLRTYNPTESGQLHRKVIEERWDIERFCLSAELQNTYYRFFWRFPPRRFDFLGITEHFESDVAILAERYFSAPFVNVPKQNVNQENPGADEQTPQRYVTDETFRQTVADFHAQDMALYKLVLAQRKCRTSHTGTAGLAE